MLCASLMTVLMLGAAAPMTPQQHLDRAIAAEAELEYETAADELLLVITNPNATEDQLIEANLLAGVVKRILGNDTEARLHFLYVLRRRPETQLSPTRSPKITTFFQLVRAEVGADTDFKPVGGMGEPPANESPAPRPIGTLPPRTEVIPSRIPGDEANDVDDVEDVEPVEDPIEPAPRDDSERQGALSPFDDDDDEGPPPREGVTQKGDGASSILPAMIGGSVLIATGAAIITGSVVGAIVLDGIFYDPSRSVTQRQSVQLISRALIATTALGAISSVGGAALIGLGWVE